MHDKLIQIEKMLTALLKSNNQLHWIGGYVHGRTSNDDPFIILYPASDKLNHKVCRVYPHDFRKLPDFVDTDVLPGITQDGNPDRDKAEKKGIYRACPPFLITTCNGKDTQMGAEVRFLDVVRVSKQKDDQDGDAAPQPPQPLTPPAPARAAQPAHVATPPPVATPAPAPSPAPAPTVSKLTARQRGLRALYDYAKSIGMSKGAVDLELTQYNGDPVDTLQALQAERGERPEPPQHPTVSMKDYWHAVYNIAPRWSQKGGAELLKKFNNNATLAYRELMSKKTQPQA